MLLIDRGYTSQECSGCGNRKLKLPDRLYHCNICGLTVDRDINAAINIKRRSMKKMDKIKHVGMGTPGLTPVEIGSIPGRATPIFETGSPLR